MPQDGSMTFDLAAVPGVPETLLSDALLAQLPISQAPAPWAVRASAVVWICRGGEAATAALPNKIRAQAKAILVIGGMVRYEDTPVGRYDEVFGVIAFRMGRRIRGNVAFMAVDSPTSLVGGRTNWSMPKTLARFDGDLANDTTFTAVGDDDSAWKISATPHLRGPLLPSYSRGTALQQFPDGSLHESKLKSRGRLKPGTVEVTVESPGPLPEWLPSGRFRGGLIDPMRFSLGEPTG